MGATPVGDPLTDSDINTVAVGGDVNIVIAEGDAGGDDACDSTTPKMAVDDGITTTEETDTATDEPGMTRIAAEDADTQAASIS